MKGVFIHNQLEFRLETKGEDYCQGDSVPCVVSVKNHADHSQNVASLRLDLAEADLKKVKQKSEGALDVLFSADCSEIGELGPQSQARAEWAFALDKNCLITDKSQSLYLVYGAVGLDGANAGLPVTVKPHRYIQEILGIIESHFQFVVGPQNSSKGWMKAKLKPPASGRFSFVEGLMLCFQFDGDALVLQYDFKVKRLETGVLSVSVKKAKTSVEQRLESSRYLLTPEHVSHDFIRAKLEEALATVAAPTL